MNKSCNNINGDSYYILHFPGSGYDENIDIINDIKDNVVSVSDDISIISPMDDKCYKESLLVKQCEANNIKIYNAALNAYSWNNTMKIQYILDSLSEVKTKYAIILDGRDTIIAKDLKEDFLNIYKSFNYPIVYNATPVPFPSVVIEPIKELIHMKNNRKYLNAGICIGDVESLKEFYTHALAINKVTINNNSEQLIIRKTKLLYPDLCTIDSECKLFRIVHHYDTIIEKNSNGYIFR